MVAEAQRCLDEGVVQSPADIDFALLTGAGFPAIHGGLFRYARQELDGIHARLAALVADGRLRNAVTAQIPFDELRTALQRVADRGVVGKLVLVP